MPVSFLEHWSRKKSRCSFHIFHCWDYVLMFVISALFVPCIMLSIFLRTIQLLFHQCTKHFPSSTEDCQGTLADFRHRAVFCVCGVLPMTSCLYNNLLRGRLMTHNIFACSSDIFNLLALLAGSAGLLHWGFIISATAGYNCRHLHTVLRFLWIPYHQLSFMCLQRAPFYELSSNQNLHLMNIKLKC